MKNVVRITSLLHLDIFFERIKDMSKEFKYELIKHYETLGSTKNGMYTTEVNLISFNGGVPKVDIRMWDRENDKMLKGVCFFKDQIPKLIEVLQKVMEDDYEGNA